MKYGGSLPHHTPKTQPEIAPIFNVKPREYNYQDIQENPYFKKQQYMMNLGRGHLKDSNIPTVPENRNPPPFMDFLWMTKQLDNQNLMRHKGDR